MRHTIDGWRREVRRSLQRGAIREVHALRAARVNFSGDGGIYAEPLARLGDGASHDPAIATARFSGAVFQRPEQRYSIAVDIDDTLHLGEKALRRRAAQAAVPLTDNAARLIAAGRLEPDLRSTGRRLVAATWTHEEDCDGLPARVTAKVSLRLATDPVSVPAEVTRLVADRLIWISSCLATAVDLPENQWIFGPGDAG
ncbi:MAG: hypothetical protein V4759_05685 [Pseudomonadota bacterium]